MLVSFCRIASRKSKYQLNFICSPRNTLRDVRCYLYIMRHPYHRCLRDKNQGKHTDVVLLETGILISEGFYLA